MRLDIATALQAGRLLIILKKHRRFSAYFTDLQ